MNFQDALIRLERKFTAPAIKPGTKNEVSIISDGFLLLTFSTFVDSGSSPLLVNRHRLEQFFVTMNTKPLYGISYLAAPRVICRVLLALRQKTNISHFLRDFIQHFSGFSIDARQISMLHSYGKTMMRMKHLFSIHQTETLTLFSKWQKYSPPFIQLAIHKAQYQALYAHTVVLHSYAALNSPEAMDETTTAHPALSTSTPVQLSPQNLDALVKMVQAPLGNKNAPSISLSYALLSLPLAAVNNPSLTKGCLRILEKTLNDDSYPYRIQVVASQSMGLFLAISCHFSLPFFAPQPFGSTPLYRNLQSLLPSPQCLPEIVGKSPSASLLFSRKDSDSSEQSPQDTFRSHVGYLCQGMMKGSHTSRLLKAYTLSLLLSVCPPQFLLANIDCIIDALSFVVLFPLAALCSTNRSSSSSPSSSSSIMSALPTGSSSALPQTATDTFWARQVAATCFLDTFEMPKSKEVHRRGASRAAISCTASYWHRKTTLSSSLLSLPLSCHTLADDTPPPNPFIPLATPFTPQSSSSSSPSSASSHTTNTQTPSSPLSSRANVSATSAESIDLIIAQHCFALAFHLLPQSFDSSVLSAVFDSFLRRLDVFDLINVMDKRRKRGTKPPSATHPNAAPYQPSSLSLKSSSFSYPHIRPVELPFSLFDPPFPLLPLPPLLLRAYLRQMTSLIPSIRIEASCAIQRITGVVFSVLCFHQTLQQQNPLSLLLTAPSSSSTARQRGPSSAVTPLTSATLTSYTDHPFSRTAHFAIAFIRTLCCCIPSATPVVRTLTSLLFTSASSLHYLVDGLAKGTISDENTFALPQKRHTQQTPFNRHSASESQTASSLSPSTRSSSESSLPPMAVPIRRLAGVKVVPEESPSPSHSPTPSNSHSPSPSLSPSNASSTSREPLRIHQRQASASPSLSPSTRSDSTTTTASTSKPLLNPSAQFKSSHPTQNMPSATPTPFAPNALSAKSTPSRSLISMVLQAASMLRPLTTALAFVLTSDAPPEPLTATTQLQRPRKVVWLKVDSDGKRKERKMMVLTENLGFLTAVQFNKIISSLPVRSLYSYLSQNTRPFSSLSSPTATLCPATPLASTMRSATSASRFCAPLCSPSSIRQPICSFIPISLYRSLCALSTFLLQIPCPSAVEGGWRLAAALLTSHRALGVINWSEDDSLAKQKERRKKGREGDEPQTDKYGLLFQGEMKLTRDEKRKKRRQDRKVQKLAGKGGGPERDFSMFDRVREGGDDSVDSDTFSDDLSEPGEADSEDERGAAMVLPAEGIASMFVVQRRWRHEAPHADIVDPADEEMVRKRSNKWYFEEGNGIDDANELMEMSEDKSKASFSSVSGSISGGKAKKRCADEQQTKSHLLCCGGEMPEFFEALPAWIVDLSEEGALNPLLVFSSFLKRDIAIPPLPSKPKTLAAKRTDSDDQSSANEQPAFSAHPCAPAAKQGAFGADRINQSGRFVSGASQGDASAARVASASDPPSFTPLFPDSYSAAIPSSPFVLHHFLSQRFYALSALSSALSSVGVHFLCTLPSIDTANNTFQEMRNFEAASKAQSPTDIFGEAKAVVDDYPIRPLFTWESPAFSLISTLSSLLLDCLSIALTLNNRFASQYHSTLTSATLMSSSSSSVPLSFLFLERTLFAVSHSPSLVALRFTSPDLLALAAEMSVPSLVHSSLSHALLSQNDIGMFSYLAGSPSSPIEDAVLRSPSSGSALSVPGTVSSSTVSASLPSNNVILSTSFDLIHTLPSSFREATPTIYPLHRAPLPRSFVPFLSKAPPQPSHVEQNIASTLGMSSPSAGKKGSKEDASGGGSSGRDSPSPSQSPSPSAAHKANNPLDVMLASSVSLSRKTRENDIELNGAGSIETQQPPLAALQFRAGCEFPTASDLDHALFFSSFVTQAHIPTHDITRHALDSVAHVTSSSSTDPNPFTLPGSNVSSSSSSAFVSLTPSSSTPVAPAITSTSSSLIGSSVVLSPYDSNSIHDNPFLLLLPSNWAASFDTFSARPLRSVCANADTIKADDTAVDSDRCLSFSHNPSFDSNLLSIAGPAPLYPAIGGLFLQPFSQRFSSVCQLTIASSVFLSSCMTHISSTVDTFLSSSPLTPSILQSKLPSHSLALRSNILLTSALLVEVIAESERQSKALESKAASEKGKLFEDSPKTPGRGSSGPKPLSALETAMAVMTGASVETERANAKGSSWTARLTSIARHAAIGTGTCVCATQQPDTNIIPLMTLIQRLSNASAQPGQAPTSATSPTEGAKDQSRAHLSAFAATVTVVDDYSLDPNSLLRFCSSRVICMLAMFPPNGLIGVSPEPANDPNRVSGYKEKDKRLSRHSSRDGSSGSGATSDSSIIAIQQGLVTSLFNLLTPRIVQFLHPLFRVDGVVYTITQFISYSFLHPTLFSASQDKTFLTAFISVLLKLSAHPMRTIHICALRALVQILSSAISATSYSFQQQSSHSSSSSSPPPSPSPSLSFSDPTTTPVYALATTITTMLSSLASLLTTPTHDYPLAISLVSHVVTLCLQCAQAAVSLFARILYTSNLPASTTLMSVLPSPLHSIVPTCTIAAFNVLYSLSTYPSSSLSSVRNQMALVLLLTAPTSNLSFSCLPFIRRWFYCGSAYLKQVSLAYLLGTLFPTDNEEDNEANIEIERMLTERGISRPSFPATHLTPPISLVLSLLRECLKQLDVEEEAEEETDTTVLLSALISRSIAFLECYQPIALFELLLSILRSPTHPSEVAIASNSTSVASTTTRTATTGTAAEAQTSTQQSSESIPLPLTRHPYVVSGSAASSSSSSSTTHGEWIDSSKDLTQARRMDQTAAGKEGESAGGKEKKKFGEREGEEVEMGLLSEMTDYSDEGMTVSVSMAFGGGEGGGGGQGGGRGLMGSLGEDETPLLYDEDEDDLGKPLRLKEKRLAGNQMEEEENNEEDEEEDDFVSRRRREEEEEDENEGILGDQNFDDEDSVDDDGEGLSNFGRENAMLQGRKQKGRQQEVPSVQEKKKKKKKKNEKAEYSEKAKGISHEGVGSQLMKLNPSGFMTAYQSPWLLRTPSSSDSLRMSAPSSILAPSASQATIDFSTDLQRLVVLETLFASPDDEDIRAHSFNTFCFSIQRRISALKELSGVLILLLYSIPSETQPPASTIHPTLLPFFGYARSMRLMREEVCRSFLAFLHQQFLSIVSLLSQIATTAPYTGLTQSTRLSPSLRPIHTLSLHSERLQESALNCISFLTQIIALSFGEPSAPGTTFIPQPSRLSDDEDEWGMQQRMQDDDDQDDDFDSDTWIITRAEVQLTLSVRTTAECLWKQLNLSNILSTKAADAGNCEVTPSHLHQIPSFAQTASLPRFMAAASVASTFLLSGAFSFGATAEHIFDLLIAPAFHVPSNFDLSIFAGEFKWHAMTSLAQQLFGDLVVAGDPHLAGDTSACLSVSLCSSLCALLFRLVRSLALLSLAAFCTDNTPLRRDAPSTPFNQWIRRMKRTKKELRTFLTPHLPVFVTIFRTIVALAPYLSAAPPLPSHIKQTRGRSSNEIFSHSRSQPASSQSSKQQDDSTSSSDSSTEQSTQSSTEIVDDLVTRSTFFNPHKLVKEQNGLTVLASCVLSFLTGCPIDVAAPMKPSMSSYEFLSVSSYLDADTGSEDSRPALRLPLTRLLTLTKTAQDELRTAILLSSVVLASFVQQIQNQKKLKPKSDVRMTFSDGIGTDSLDEGNVGRLIHQKPELPAIQLDLASQLEIVRVLTHFSQMALSSPKILLPSAALSTGSLGPIDLLATFSLFGVNSPLSQSSFNLSLSSFSFSTLYSHFHKSLLPKPPPELDPSPSSIFEGESLPLSIPVSQQLSYLALIAPNCGYRSAFTSLALSSHFSLIRCQASMTYPTLLLSTLPFNLRSLSSNTLPPSASSSASTSSSTTVAPRNNFEVIHGLLQSYVALSRTCDALFPSLSHSLAEHPDSSEVDIGDPTYVISLLSSTTFLKVFIETAELTAVKLTEIFDAYQRHPGPIELFDDKIPATRTTVFNQFDSLELSVLVKSLLAGLTPLTHLTENALDVVVALCTPSERTVSYSPTNAQKPILKPPEKLKANEPRGPMDVVRAVSVCTSFILLRDVVLPLLLFAIRLANLLCAQKNALFWVQKENYIPIALHKTILSFATFIMQHEECFENYAITTFSSLASTYIYSPLKRPAKATDATQPSFPPPFTTLSQLISFAGLPQNALDSLTKPCYFEATARCSHFEKGIPRFSFTEDVTIDGLPTRNSMHPKADSTIVRRVSQVIASLFTIHRCSTIYVNHCVKSTTNSGRPKRLSLSEPLVAKEVVQLLSNTLSISRWMPDGAHLLPIDHQMKCQFRGVLLCYISHSFRLDASTLCRLCPMHDVITNLPTCHITLGRTRIQQARLNASKFDYSEPKLRNENMTTTLASDIFKEELDVKGRVQEHITAEVLLLTVLWTLEGMYHTYRALPLMMHQVLKEDVDFILFFSTSMLIPLLNALTDCPLSLVTPTVANLIDRVMTLGMNILFYFSNLLVLFAQEVLSPKPPAISSVHSINYTADLRRAGILKSRPATRDAFRAENRPPRSETLLAANGLVGLFALGLVHLCCFICTAEMPSFMNSKPDVDDSVSCLSAVPTPLCQISGRPRFPAALVSCAQAFIVATCAFYAPDEHVILEAPLCIGYKTFLNELLREARAAEQRKKEKIRAITEAEQQRKRRMAQPSRKYDNYTESTETEFTESPSFFESSVSVDQHTSILNNPSTQYSASKSAQKPAEEVRHVPKKKKKKKDKKKSWNDQPDIELVLNFD